VLTCERQGCGKEFRQTGTATPKKYCSGACGARARNTRHRDKDPKRLSETRKAYYRAHPREYFGRYLKSEYGLSLARYDEMVLEQCGKCALCGESMSENGAISVDHDHVTGKVRELLHRHCNIGLTYVEDTAFRARAEAYLGKHRE